MMEPKNVCPVVSGSVGDKGPRNFKGVQGPRGDIGPPVLTE